MNGNGPAGRADVIEDLVVCCVAPHLRENIQIGQDLRPIDGNIENSLTRRRDARVGLGELQGHLIGPRGNVETVGKGVAVTLGLVKSIVGGPVDGRGNGGRGAAREVGIGRPKVPRSIGIGRATPVHPPGRGHDGRGGVGRREGRDRGSLMVDPNVIDPVFLWKDRGAIRIARPSTADSQVQK